MLTVAAYSSILAHISLFLAVKYSTVTNKEIQKSPNMRSDMSKKIDFLDFHFLVYWKFDENTRTILDTGAICKIALNLLQNCATVKKTRKIQNDTKKILQISKNAENEYLDANIGFDTACGLLACHPPPVN